MSGFRALCAAALCAGIVSCAAEEPAPVPVETAEREPAEPSAAVSSLSSIRAMASSDEPRELDMSLQDTSRESISPFRGLYLPEQRAAYDEIYETVRNEPGVRERYEAATQESLDQLGLSLTLPSLLYSMTCAAGIDVQGRREIISPYESTYNSKYWLYTAFAELDQRNAGSVAGFPEVVPGIERFPERRRDFTPAPAVSEYREQVYILYMLERDAQLEGDSRTLNARRVEECWNRQPPAVSYYGGNSFAVR